MTNRRSGIIFISVNGVNYDAKGNFNYNLGGFQREAIAGADRIHGYKEMPKIAFIEGEITDRSNLDVAELQAIDNATVTLELANGKTIVLREAWFSGEGTVGTEEANIALRFEANQGEEI